jgi:membrane fusion protein (multidrug efflux system)
VVALDPIEVDFSIGERQYLNYMEAVSAGTQKDFTPQIRLATGKLYEHKGKIYVVSNEVDPTTGTIAIRLKFPNPDRLLLPGQYVTVLLTEAQSEKRVVVPQSAVQQNQAGPFVLVVDSENRVESRAIKAGQRVGTGIVVTEGLVPGETIVVEGIQKVQPGGEVQVSYKDPSATAENIDGPPGLTDSDSTTDGQAADASESSKPTKSSETDKEAETSEDADTRVPPSSSKQTEPPDAESDAAPNEEVDGQDKAEAKQ